VTTYSLSSASPLNRCGPARCVRKIRSETVYLASSCSTERKGPYLAPTVGNVRR
jgi:hypothetical protein